MYREQKDYLDKIEQRLFEKYGERKYYKKQSRAVFSNQPEIKGQEISCGKTQANSDVSMSETYKIDLPADRLPIWNSPYYRDKQRKKGKAIAGKQFTRKATG